MAAREHHPQHVVLDRMGPKRSLLDQRAQGSIRFEGEIGGIDDYTRSCDSRSAHGRLPTGHRMRASYRESGDETHNDEGTRLHRALERDLARMPKRVQCDQEPI